MERVLTHQGNARTEVDTRASAYISGVYLQMTAGIMLSALVAYGLVLSGLMVDIIDSGGRAAMWGIIILQFGTIMMVQPMISSQSANKLKALFFFYAAVTGVTVGYVTFAYTIASIFNVFFATSFAFAGLAAFGYVTKRNLGMVGTFCMQALWMVIGMSLLQLIGSFFPALGGFIPALNMATGLVGVLVFSGLTAYESQQIRNSAYGLASSPYNPTQASIFTSSHALSMYLNFVNMFFSLLRLTGRRR